MANDDRVIATKVIMDLNHQMRILLMWQRCAVLKNSHNLRNLRRAESEGVETSLDGPTSELRSEEIELM